MFTAQDVSIVIPSFNSRGTIEACLASLQVQTVAPQEVILVDSSSDDTMEIVKRNFPQVRLTPLQQRKFPGPARNRGVRLAQGAIVAFIDADCIADPDWLERIVAAHNAGHCVVGGSIAVGNAHSKIAWAGHLGEFREFLPVGRPRQMLHVPTCNISYRKSIFEEYGGFPDSYYPQEDLLFNYLLHREGIRVWFDPAICVRHFYRERLDEFLSHQHRIGRVTHSTLRRIDLGGTAIARRPLLSWLLAPLLGVLKFLRTVAIFGVSFPEKAFRQPSLLFMLALGSIWWARGFAASARTGLSGVQGWNDPEEPIFAHLSMGGKE